MVDKGTILQRKGSGFSHICFPYSSICLFFAICFLFSLVAGSCVSKDNIKLSDYYDFNKEGMKPGLEYMFYPFEELKDSVAVINIDLSLRYSDLCELKSLPLLVEYASLENDSIRQMTIQLPLFNDEGELDGKGNFGVYEKKLSLFKNLKREEGFFISVSTPEIKTNGILSLGIVSN